MVKKHNANRLVVPTPDNPTTPPEPSDKPGSLNTGLTGEATSYTPSSPSTSPRLELSTSSLAQPEPPSSVTTSETQSSSQSQPGTTHKVTMSSGRLPSFVRGKANKTVCGPISCAVRQTVIAQLHHSAEAKEREYSLSEATEIFLWKIWRDKSMQITALSSGS